MKLINQFNKVRDITYHIPVGKDDEDCCCNGKTRKLKTMVEDEGLETRYRVCSFRWSDLNIPEDILSLQKDDIATHVYLEVLIDGSWVKVDPTWDSALRNVFQISEWDGKTDTLLAVDPIEVYSVEKSYEIMNSCQPEDIAQNRSDVDVVFETAFNTWLEKKREIR